MKDFQEYQHEVETLNHYVRHQFSIYLAPEFELYHLNALQYSLLKFIDTQINCTLSMCQHIFHLEKTILLQNIQKMELNELLSSTINTQEEYLRTSELGHFCVHHIHDVINQHYSNQWNQYNEKDKYWILQNLKKINKGLRYLKRKEDTSSE